MGLDQLKLTSPVMALTVTVFEIAPLESVRVMVIMESVLALQAGGLLLLTHGTLL